MRDRTSQPSKIANGQTPKQGENKPFNNASQNTPRVNNGGQNGKMPGKDKQKDKTSFKKPSDDKKGVPRASMVCEREHVQEAKRYAGFHSKRSGTFTLYQADDDQEMQDEQDTGYHSYLAQYDHRCHEDHMKMNITSKDTLVEKDYSFNHCDMEMQNVEPVDSANILEMTEDELEQAHEIFMLTVDKGHSEMKAEQETTPEQMLTLTAEELNECEQLPLLEDADLINISLMTDTGLDGSTDENAEDKPYLTWEEADQNEEQLQFEQCV